MKLSLRNTLALAAMFVAFTLVARPQTQTLGTSQAQTMPSIALTNTTNQIVSGAGSNLTTLNLPASSGAVTVTGPVNAGSVPVFFDCGSTGSGNQTCSPAAASGNYHGYSGRSTLSSNAATITFPIAFTASTSFTCVANDVTTRANPVQMVPASSTTATITNTTGASDVIQWACHGT